MPSHPEHDGGSQPRGPSRGVLVRVVLVAAVLVVIVLLHVLGVLGTPLHG